MKQHPYLEIEHFHDSLTLEDQVHGHGPITLDDLLLVAVPMAEALRAAQGANVLHGDVKPGNLLVRKTVHGWEVKVIDFGLSLRRSLIQGSQARTVSQGRSMVGSAVADTLHYAAPEQLDPSRGKEVGPHSDVFGFGRTCYFALFREPNPDQEDLDSLPQPWKSLLGRCTAKRIDRRPNDFAAVLMELRVIQGPSLTAVLPPPSATEASAPVATSTAAQVLRPERDQTRDRDLEPPRSHARVGESDYVARREPLLTTDELEYLSDLQDLLVEPPPDIATPATEPQSTASPPRTAPTDSLSMTSGPVEYGRGPRPPALPEDDLATEDLSELLFSFELEGLEQAPLDSPAMETTLEDEPPLPELMTNTVGMEPATIDTDSFPMRSPDPEKGASHKEKRLPGGIFGNFVRKFTGRNDGDHGSDAEVRFSTAVSRIKKGNLKSGFNIINNLLKTNPDFIQPWEFCGDWYHRHEEYPEASFHYEEAIKLGTTNPHTYIRAAIAAAHTGDVESAYAILKHSTTKLSHEDVPGVLWFNLGCYATRLQKNDEAMRYLKVALNSGFTDTSKYLADPDLLPLRQRQDFALLLESVTDPPATDSPPPPAGAATATADAGRTRIVSQDTNTISTNESDTIIGIDLGTSNSVVAVMEGGEVTVIPNQQGSRITPSVVGFTSNGKTLVGEPAKRQSITNPKGTINSIQRFMGRRRSEVQDEEKTVPYEVVGGPSDYVTVRTGGKERTPPEVSA